MSYSLSGSVITQASGTTDSDLSGLASITGVTVFNSGIRSLYILDGLQLKIKGTQTINPFTEGIFTQNWGSQYNVINEGNLTIAGYRNYSGFDQYSRQPWLISSENDNQFCFRNNTNSTLTWTGGAIHSKRGIYLQGSVTLNNIVADGVHVNRFQFVTSSLTINGSITLQGFRCSLSNKKPISNLIMTGAKGIDFSSTAGRNNIGNGLHYVITDYVYQLSDAGCNIRYFNTAEFINTEKGSALDVRPQAPTSTSDNNNGGIVAVYKKIKFNVKDLSGNNLQGAKVYFSTYDDGNRVDVSSSFGSEFDFTGTDVFSLTTDASGNTATSQVLLVAHTLATLNANDLNVSYYSKNGDTTDLYTVDYYKYGYLKSQLDVSMKGTGEKTQEFVSLPDLSISEATKSTVDAYTQIDTSAKFYDRAAAYLEDNFGSFTGFLVSRSGNQIDAGSYNVTIDATAASAFDITGNLITIKASTFTGDMVTTGLIILANGAIFNGVRTDANGTIEPNQPISITNISAGSRLRIYNVTTGTETVNIVVAGTSYISSYQEGTGYNDGDTVRVYLTKLGKDEWVGDVIDTSNGFNVLASQVDNDVYTALGEDGSTVTKFQADYPNNEVDLIIGSDWTMAELYAWWSYNLTTEDGIRNFFGGITAIDQANFRINTAIVDLYLDNTTNASYRQTDNRRFFRDSGDGYPVRSPTTSGYGLDVVWRNTILIAQTEAGGTSDLNFYDVKRAVKQVITNPKYVKGQK
ncbi:MAG: hypothetical protein GY787_13130 [Alteromonadales bacterium]|nr:hypothetical protein [Alteromonadales bacterium]